VKEGLVVYNSLIRKKEAFVPINPPLVGMYVCGPTVYGEAHLGHARGAITFDIIFRYLRFLEYKVRYVRNITDVGHLEMDADEGEDKIAKKARLEMLEPMEVAKFYTANYHEVMNKLNVLSPSIEPQASGHIPEQIEMIEGILKNGFAYESQGSVYFDVENYAQKHNYGVLSGRNIEDQQTGNRILEGQDSKKSPLDFALWKKASPEHIMRWNSPWSEGFPGWHLECSAMSSKYLGNHFDIHGGGMDLLFPHHECEVAQSVACHHETPAKYWLHNNMITINGQKMGKSLGNFITMNELFTGDHELLEQAYSPMTIRFFILQAHYRSTLDFSNEALKAAQKGLRKILNGLRILKKMELPLAEVPKNKELSKELLDLSDACFKGMQDDFNTAISVASLFNLLKKINSFYTKAIDLNTIELDSFNRMKQVYISLVEDVLGLAEEESSSSETFREGLLQFYKEAKEAKQYDKVDAIRALFKREGLVIKDMKHGIDWAYEE
jgi:cysteinyl-tRNA synthetase